MLRDIIPARYRRAIYVALTAAYSLELIFNLIPEGTQTQIVQALAALGFTLAAANTREG